ncbi:GntR family transcriptional regulator [Amycolatopsis mediterranei S699]|uniref:GntR family transcriptional regulator n=2 Tax=Amycolatopsis mediterranei TaxID=33910 RepID=A0A0H3DFT5_AMYMU|nr:GntR family transcriptional regulator [Amycolatopsis mediterranei]ADJ48978.1 GntR family transcriptional regulator [Amycolatopsis mediterranei U32]AEK45928.1 GntR family transcriptional regulator [Amycolatopsis mediterranei S699]AFO80686.1 GntR family transcriptional regulator [Amycolatopsis mediterranei S699]AGT87814.1 GntR family transcriptional regulator [Amycolatopsis mediterranei RB]KDU93904.1 GntR family transcriptional regulator [Amycolatopsis mediterranei]
MNTTPSIAVSTTTLIDAVYESLRQRIATGEIASGERVTEARVVGDYNVARPTAKACIERLVNTGLLQRAMHKSATVTALTAADVDDLFLARTTIEVAAARQLATSGDVPRAMLEAQHAIDLAGKLDDRAALVRADIDFHSSMVRASGSKRLARMHELITGEILLTIGSAGHQSAPIPVVAAEHAKILDALRARRVDEASAQLIAHLDSAHTRVRGAFS